MCVPLLLSLSRLTSRQQITIDEFIDVLIGTRKYLPCLCMSVALSSLDTDSLDG